MIIWKNNHNLITIIDYRTLIESWLEYIRLEELSNLKIKKNSIENFRLYKLNFEGTIVTSINNTIMLTFHNLSLFNYLMEKREDKTKNFYLLFPLIEDIKSSEPCYYPLCIIHFSEEIINFLKLDINQEKTGLRDI